MMDNSEIPEFLLRKDPAKGRRKKYSDPKRTWKMPKLPYQSEPPKSNSYRGAERVSVMLADECPSIGCGIRSVWAKRGTKWARMCDSTGNKGKMRVADFDKVIRKENK
tara:strand:+ start:22101 stop:22424 length:324 start_codon:yes stop_codon:yes gene_type:complete